MPATAELESAGGNVASTGFLWKEVEEMKEGLLRTLFQDDNRRSLAAKRHVDAGWALGILV